VKAITGGRWGPFVFVLRGGEADELQIYFEILEDHGFVTAGFAGDRDVSFSYKAWNDAANLLYECALLAGVEETQEEIAAELLAGYRMVLTGCWGVDEEEPAEEEQERLHIYSAMFRLVYQLCQGKSIAARDVGRILTRHAGTARTILNMVSAAQDVPLQYDRETRTWQILATYYLRP